MPDKETSSPGTGGKIKGFAAGSGDTPFSASRMNEIVDRLNPLQQIEISRGDQDAVQYSKSNVRIIIGQTSTGGGGGGDDDDPPDDDSAYAQVKQYTLVGVFNDYLVCYPFILIAKPAKLRNSITQQIIFKSKATYTYGDGPDVTTLFPHGNNQIRVCKLKGVYETQMVIPLWLLDDPDGGDGGSPEAFNVNDTIYAVNVDNTGVFVSGVELTLLMVGEARQWARVELDGSSAAAAAALFISSNGTQVGGHYLNVGDMLGMYAFADLPGITDLTFNQAASLAGFNFQNTTTPQTMSFPSLASIDPTNTQAGSFQILSNAGLLSIDAPLLAAIGGSVAMYFNPLLDSVNLPALASIVGDVNITSNDVLTSCTLSALTSCPNLSVYGNPLLTTLGLSAFTTATNEAVIDFWGTSLNLSALVTVGVGGLSILGSFTSITLTALVSVGPDVFVISAPITSLSLPAFVPDNGLTQDFSGCSLNAASVNGILHRAVLNAAYVSGSIDTTGANAAPTGAGITDKATLIGRGVSVSTN